MKILVNIFLVILILFLLFQLIHDSIWLFKFPYSVGDEVNLHMHDDDYIGRVKWFDSDNNEIFIEFGDRTYEINGVIKENKNYKVVKFTLQEFCERVF